MKKTLALAAVLLLATACSSINLPEFCNESVPEAIAAVKAVCEGNATCDALSPEYDLPGCSEACEVLDSIQDFCEQVP